MEGLARFFCRSLREEGLKNCTWQHQIDKGMSKANAPLFAHQLAAKEAKAGRHIKEHRQNLLENCHCVLHVSVTISLL